MSKGFSDSEVLSTGWSTFKENAGFWIGAIVVGIIALLIPMVLASMFEEGFLYLLFMVIYFLVAILISIGWIRLSLNALDKKKLEMATLFTGYKLLLPYIALSILTGIAIYAGFLALIIPGIILTIMFMMAPWIMVDKGLGPIESLKESMRITKGSRWDLLGFMATSAAVGILGFLALGVGLLVAMPVIYLAQGAIYKKLR